MLCKNCEKETNNDKFCSRSCSASFNNRGVTRNGSTNYCLECNERIISGNKFCSLQHQQDYQYRNRIATWLETGYIGKSTLKRYLSSIKDSCWKCGVKDWNGKPLVLELEHKDGDSGNNSEDNVELLCPNCHSQTETYKGKNRGKGRHARRVRYRNGLSY